jgi:hypothetical protein
MRNLRLMSILLSVTLAGVILGWLLKGSGMAWLVIVAVFSIAIAIKLKYPDCSQLSYLFGIAAFTGLVLGTAAA